MNAAHASKARQQASMVLEFPMPHIAVLKPNPAVVRARKFGIAAIAISAIVAVCIAVMALYQPGQKTRLGPLYLGLLVAFFHAIGIAAISRRSAGTAKGINFDRRQGMMWKEARKLEPIWQGGIRLRDVASLALSTTQIRGGTLYALDMVMSRPQGQRASLIVHGNRDAMKADAGELARFLSIPLADRTA